MENYVIVTMLGYLFGCFQASYILGKLFKKVDIRTLGNGNAGASNTVVALGWKYGVAVGLLDIGKAILSIIVVRLLLKNILPQGQTPFFLYLNGLSVILGHNYPFYMGFRGGKGTASLIGMLSAVDYRIAALGIAAILAITIATDYIALGTISLVILFVASTFYFGYSKGCIIIAIILAALSIYNHRANIINIIQKRETGLRSTMKKKQTAN
ncbi:glycerol-3-phosphate acyltransferase [Proteiniborus sp. MB09-C3]|uniref:glycerol-3-phosphate acyltransferase n=1 Tax=Proteiniborus sp. MB09-C3 TaxID=3050072 RepID=UPI0025538C5C|nr:glycerol-3-phosphate acyltransferase [Proteiniborus sp. MB09-C3]WIV12365.1 glycerol-3-phosphate acyltransferase [Proteiniborus sp. MB09-C3]